MIEEFRISQYRTITSVRYLLIIILVPLLINQLSKNLLFDPLVKGWWINKPSEVFLNSSQEERALAELKRFREKIRFEVLVKKTLELSIVATEEKLKDKATQIIYKYKIESAEAVGNIFADIDSFSIYFYFFSRSRPRTDSYFKVF
ncbi:hypothetical protein ACE1B6_10045 [Aerosakkonemataceae cyanobacterium BLCC-F154]|uniref:Uncharacterized protein n=1 Tax=Floridaenema fluviatile BLCC-F154 TaxID=3153640 RepID=A0ABV4YAS5_9CYAN